MQKCRSKYAINTARIPFLAQNIDDCAAQLATAIKQLATAADAWEHLKVSSLEQIALIQMVK